MESSEIEKKKKKKKKHTDLSNTSDIQATQKGIGLASE